MCRGLPRGFDRPNFTNCFNNSRKEKLLDMFELQNMDYLNFFDIP